MNFLRLIRYKNLLIIIATMIVMRYAMVAQFMPLQLSFLNFCLLVIATVCLSGAGYIINDYFDVNADMMNKPDEVIIGKIINRRNAMILHWILNIVGIIAGTILSFAINKPNFTFIFLFIMGILWFYSTTFSKEPILGNVVIAILVAIVPIIEVLFEMLPLLSMTTADLSVLHIQFEEILMWTIGYAVFAFIITLQREMVKDIEDVEGDRTYGRNTLPIAFGLGVARGATIGVGILVIISLILVQICELNSVYSLLFLNICILIPLIFALIKFIKAKVVEDYSLVSSILKLVMLIGIFYLILNMFFIENA